VAKRHQAEARQPLSGWWGHARPFAFEQGFDADAGIRRFQCGTQPILSLRALKGALDVWDDVDMAALRTKSIALCDLFIALVEAKCADHGLTLESPRDGARRGSQVSFAHKDAYQIMQALIERGVIGDFRAPATLRFGFTPLYVELHGCLAGSRNAGRHFAQRRVAGQTVCRPGRGDLSEPHRACRS
jgi:kynureninase